MIPYSYEMVNMGGIDLAEANGTVVEGIYNRIVEAVNACGDAIFYNWKFAGIEISPSPVNTLEVESSILINGLIQVTEQDEITVLGIEPPPPPIVPVSPLEVAENGVYTAQPPASGFNPVTVNVPARVYTNSAVAPDEQITDLTGFTLLYSSTIQYGNRGAKVDSRLAITNESSHSNLQAGGWDATGMCYYDAENLIGAYAGYNFGREIFISKAKFWLNRYYGQNKTLIATIEYFDGSDWQEVEDIQITNNIPYPSHIFEVQINRAVYGVRWIHKKEPKKTTSNNITFAGMSIYHIVGDPTNVYIPVGSGIITPPEGYVGFGPLYIV